MSGVMNEIQTLGYDGMQVVCDVGCKRRDMLLVGVTVVVGCRGTSCMKTANGQQGGCGGLRS